MNKIFNIFAISAMVFMVSSCSKNDDENTNDTKIGEKVHVKFSANVETSNSTRANFADLKGGSCAFNWEKDDIVGIYADGSSTLEEVTATIISGNDATLEGTITKGSSYLGIYPKSVVSSKVSKNSAVITIPTSQLIPEDKYVDPDAFIQVGYTTKGAFSMNTPCSFLKFSTGSRSDITSVKVTAYDGSNNVYAIAGPVTVTKSETGTIELKTGNNENNVVTCTHANGTFPANKDFAIAIRPGSPSKIAVEIKGSSTITKYATNQVTSTGTSIVLDFARAYYYDLGDLSLY